jgi:hypothetical protein
MNLNYKNVNLYQIICDIHTGIFWSANSRCYELFGKHLTKLTEVPTEYEHITLAHSNKSPNEIYMIINVDWDKSEWLEAKKLASKALDVDDLIEKRAFAEEVKVFENEQALLDDYETEMKATFLEVLESNKGLLNSACKESRTPLTQYQSWMRTDINFVEAVNQIKESVVDDVEASLIKQAKDGDSNAIKYFLDAKAKERGYGKSNGETVDQSNELDLSLLTYTEQETLHKLLLKAQSAKTNQQRLLK